MSEVEAKVARGGARAARRAARTAPLPDNLRPVRPGMSGGYATRPLSDADVLRIHHAALDVLETIGLCRRNAERHRIRDQGRRAAHAARPPGVPARVDRGYRGARRSPLRTARSGPETRHGAVGLARVYFGTAGAAVHIVDGKTGVYRDSTTKDLYDISRLVDTLEHLHLPSALGRLPRGGDSRGNGHQYRLRERRGHHQACRYQLGAAGAPRGEPRDVSSHGGRRGQVAGAPVRQPVELLRRASAQVRLRCVPLSGNGRAGRHAGAAACPPGKPARRRPRRLPPRWCRKWPSAWQGWSTSTPSNPGRRRFSAPGVWSRICAPARCRAGARNRRCSPQLAPNCRDLYDLTGGTASGMSDAKMPDMQAGYEKAC